MKVLFAGTVMTLKGVKWRGSTPVEKLAER